MVSSELLVESLKGKTVLLVEDESVIALSEQLILERYGLQVVVAPSGERAVATMAEREGIDLILMDINLGEGMDGTEAAQRILDDYDVPLIFLSSHTEREVVERTEGITSYGYIVKNSGETVLMASIKMAFRLFQATVNERAHEAALREERDRARRYLNIAGVVIVALDPSFRVTLINDKGCELLGYARQDIVGKDWFQTCAPDSVSSEQRRGLEAVLRGEKPLQEYHENTVRTAGGETRTIAWHHSLLRDPNGAIVGTLSSGEDITERVLAEEELRRHRRLESFLAEITTELVDEPDERIDSVLAASIDRIGALLGIEWAAHVGVSADGSQVDIRHLFAAHREDALPLVYSRDEYPFFCKAFRERRARVFRTGDVLPTELTEQEQRLLEASHFVCVVIVPVSVEGSTVSCIVGASRSDPDAFSPHVVEELTRLAKVFAGAIARQRAFDRLDQSRDALTDIADNAPGMVFQYQMEPDGTMSFPFVGNGAKRQYGIDAEKLRRTPSLLAEGIPAEDVLRYQDAVRTSQEQLTRFHITHRYRMPDGTIRWMEVRSTPRRLSDGSTLWNGIAVDVTEQKRAEAALLEEATFSRALGESVPALLYLYDVTKKRNVWSNRRHKEFFRSATHKPPDSLSGEEVVSLVHEDDVPKLLALIEEMLTDASVSHYDVEMRVRSGETWRWMRLFVTEFARDSDGRLKEVMGALFDIGEQKETEHRLAAMIEERDVLLREVNHRVKNNLLMVHSLLSLRESAAGLDLTDVKNQVTSIGLVHELLHGGSDITHVEAPTYIDRILRSVFGRGPTVRTDIEPVRLPAGVAVPFGLLLNELATNAAQHGFVDGSQHTFTLKLRHDSDAEELVVTAANTGARFPDHVEPATAGTLGLRLINALVAQLSGSLELRREPDTTFIVRVPFSNDVAEGG